MTCGLTIIADVPTSTFITNTCMTLHRWFNYVASMSVLESGRQDDTTVFRYRHLLISLLIVVRLLPNVVIAPLGGVLADTRDLRKVMILLDLLSAVVALSFWLAQVLQMPFLIYVSTMVQECLAGLYEPCRSAIVPQMVKEPAYLHKATTLSGVAWSTMAAVGSSLGGFLVASLGVPTCFGKVIACLLECQCQYSAVELISLFLQYWIVCPMC